MPVYGTQNPPSALFAVANGPAASYTVLNREAVVASEYSERVVIPPPAQGAEKGIRIVIDFNQNPGTFEFIVLESDNDAAGSSDYYQVPAGGDLTQANIGTGPNGASTRIVTDLLPFQGQFVCLWIKTPPSNGGTLVTAKVTRSE